MEENKPTPYERKTRGVFARLLGRNHRGLSQGSANRIAPFAFLIFYILLFAYYYIFQVPRNEAGIVERSFRVLALTGEQIRSELANSAIILKTWVDLEDGHFRDAFDETLTNGGGEDIFPEHFKATHCPAKFADAAEIELNPQYDTIGARLRIKSDQDTPACGETTIKGLVARFAKQVPYDVFDEIAVADARGKVLYQKAQTAFRLADIKSLLDQADRGLPPAQTPTAELTEAAKALFGRRTGSTAGFSRLADVTLAGTQYKMFVQPVSWPIEEVYEGKPAGDFRLLLCGFILTDRLNSRSKALPIHYIVFLSCSIGIGLLAAWPILKIRRMAPTEGFRPREILWFAISILGATRLVTILVLYGTQLSAPASIEPQLKELAQNIEDNLRQELDLSLATLHSFSSSSDLSANEKILAVAAGGQAKDIRSAFDQTKKTELLAGSSAGIAQRWYPYFDQVFWTLNHSDPRLDGFQGVKWAVKAMSTDLTSVKPFYYYSLLTSGRFWELDAPRDSRLKQVGGDTNFVLEPMYSPNTGEYLTLLVQPVQASGLSMLRAGVMVTPLVSLVDSVVPAGFGFAILDEDGAVRFHSDSNRNGRENFLREFESGRDLQAAMLSGSSRFLTGKYQGKDHFLYTQPLKVIRNVHSTLVVFLDAADRSHFYVDVFLLTLCCSVGFALWDGVLILLGCRFLFGISEHWHWPETKKLRTLNLLVLLNVVIFVVSMFFYGLARPSLSSYFVWSLPPLVIGVSVLGFALHYRGFGRYQPRTDRLLSSKFAGVLRRATETLKVFPFRTSASAFLAAALMMVVVLAIFPCAMLFRLAFNHERLFYMADQQICLAEALEARANRVRLYYRKVKTNALPGPDEAFLARRMRLTLDRYDLLWRERRTVSAVVPREGELAELSGDPITPHFAWMTEFVPHPLSPTERMTKGWRWKWRLEEEPNVLVMRDAHNQEDEDIRSDLPIFRRPQNVVLVLILIGGLTLIIFGALRYTTYKRFLTKLDPADRWKEFTIRPDQEIDRNLLVVGWPRAGKTKRLRQRKDCFFIDIPERVKSKNWAPPTDEKLKGFKVVVVDEFQYGIDQPELNQQKLLLVADLVKNRHVKVVIVSTVDPIFYLFEEYFDPHSSPSTGGDLAGHPVYKAALALSSFEKCTITPVRAQPDPEREQLLWATCSKREQLALSQLVSDGAVNPKNRFALCHLYARGLVDESSQGEGIFHIANPHFAKFVESELPEKLVDSLRKTEHDTAWHATKQVYVVTVFAAILFLLTVWQDYLKAGLAEITSMLAVGSTMFTFLPQVAQFAMNFRKGGEGVNA